MKNLLAKISSIILTLILVVSSVFVPSLTASAETTEHEAIISAATSYIEANQNNSTLSGLLSAVQQVNSSVTLERSDFFIKHAVPGVTDNDTTSGYQLSIPGSNGAVTAIFSLNGERIVFSKAFSNEEEVIEINEVAIVGTSSGFSYDDNNNVIGYSGTADKIIFPQGYYGVMTKLEDMSSVNNVKVLIIDTDDTGKTYATCNRLKEYSYSEWQSLVAVEFGIHAHPRLLFDNQTLKTGTTDKLYANGSVPGIFSACPNLKYVKLPQTLYAQQFSISHAMFENCTKLENVIFTENSANDKLPFAWRAFAYTAVYDFFLPSWAEMNESVQSEVFYGGKCRAHSEGQVINYSTAMTFPRAIALITADLHDKDISADTIVADIKAAIVGSSDATTYANGLTIINNLTENDYALSGDVTVSDGNDIFIIDTTKSYSLSSLDIGYAISPDFTPETTHYTVTVPNSVTSLTVNAVPVEGAEVLNISGNDNLIEGSNSVTVSVLTTNEKNVVYTITVNRQSKLSQAAFVAADNYVQTNKNNVTKEGLLAAVNTVLQDATLADNDFYIRHSVPSVSDNDTTSGYELNIAGSAGSVSAVFVYANERLSFNTSFKQLEETLNISNYAIVGNADYADYFDYDASGNVTAINKPVEKLIFPTDYTGTMLVLSEEESMINADRVKVLIYNGLGTLKDKAFKGWEGLIAVQMGDQTHNQYGFKLASSGDSTFANCANLKYFKFPNHINTSGYNGGSTLLPNSFLYNNPLLENVIFPTKVNGIAKWYNEELLQVSYGFWSLRNTAVREILLPKINMNDGINVPAEGSDVATFSAPAFSQGTRNIHYYPEQMTLIRAVSLIDSALSSEICTNESEIIAVAKNAVLGSFDAIDFANKLQFVWNENKTDNILFKGVLTVTDGTDYFDIDTNFSKTLAELSVNGYNLSTDFDPTVLDYVVSVPYSLSEIEINASAVNGAAVDTIRKEIYSIEPVEINVTTASGDTVTYLVSIFRKGNFTLDNLIGVRKALLGIANNIEIDMNGDKAFNVLDLVRAKKKLAFLDSTTEDSNIIQYSAVIDGVTAEDLTETLGYVNKEGKIVDTLFNGVAFMAQPNWVSSYNPDNPMTHNKRDWSNFIYNNIFKDGKNIHAFEKAAGRIKSELNMPEYKVSVYLPLFNSADYFENWGSVNGEVLDFTDNNDRITALKWSVDEMITAFEANNFENLELCGFYFISEAIDKDDQENLEVILPAITDYIRTNNLITYYAPYAQANGSNRQDTPAWNEYGFDEATFQINYFPGASDLPNSYTDPACIENIAVKARDLGAGIQMELAATNQESITAFKEYFAGGIEYGYMNNDFISWWIQDYVNTLSDLCNSDDIFYRSTYDEIYKFINKTLTTSDIYTMAE